MAIQRWDPLRDLLQLQERMNRMFDEALARSPGPGLTETLSPSAWKPPVDLFEEGERYVLLADVPGTAAADVEVLIEEDQLVLRGERRPSGTIAPEAFLRVERPHGRFVVQIALPPSVDTSGIRATHRQGVLELVLPKKRALRSGRVAVTTD